MKKQRKRVARDEHEKPSLKKMRWALVEAYVSPLPLHMTAKAVRESYRELVAGKQVRP